MSDSVENRPTNEPGSSTPPDRDGPPRCRRRGSRGGRNRNRSLAGQQGQQAATDAARLPDDLPDRPSEDRPSPEAGARAEVARRKPKIGDTRPAPAPAEGSNGANGEARQEGQP